MSFPTVTLHDPEQRFNNPLEAPAMVGKEEGREEGEVKRIQRRRGG